MKMFERVKIKKYIKKHPEIFDLNNKYHSISDNEIPDIMWFYEKNHDLIQKKNANKQKKRWYLSKRIIIPISAVFVLGIFFGATPTGRAMAEKMYYTVVQWMTGEVNIWHGSGDVPPEKIDLETTTYQSIKEVKDNYDIRIATSNLGVLYTIEVEKTEYQIIFHSTYTLSDQSSIVLTQTINDSETEAAASFDFNEGQAIDVTTADGINAIGYVNDGNGYAIAFHNNITLEIYSDNITYDLFIGFLQSLKME